MNTASFVSRPDDRLPRYQQLRDDLVSRIAAGEWAPEEAIATEAELGQFYNVSTGTVRKAIDLLVSDGVLTRTQGKGTFVRRPRFDSSLFRFFRFVSRDGQPVRPTARVLKREVVKPSEEIRNALRMKASEKAIHLSRVRMIEGQAVLSEEIWLPRARFEALAALPLDKFEDLLYPLYERLCKQMVASATEILRVEQATAETASLLGMKTGSPVILVHRVASDFAGTPFEWRSTRGAADTFQYQVEIR
ncbi:MULTISPECIES: GntR family transcriptional regulator [Paraburkholderia]|jgi:GntR family transcriptional regulator|uniref:GntR family transcriptional regulator n=2 Tax=Paraburkholderia TaxID=1822464 RepID=A0ABU1L3P7_9BURK|nr:MULTISPECIES: GntR family transcriptional regulator [Paraburkholderia]MBT2789471.1 GntR family transcriptional regulator [Paraburkholderia strydomiana]MDR6377775.1 GntR family transcriptional regulator [Paraburkholderia caledonica]MDR7005642.1 GntR family transcriptional regulator [Paraburkholderia strydomiana]TCF98545.1 GntR family transcriptional regulator [Paraburkholderia strydomiana]